MQRGRNVLFRESGVTRQAVELSKNVVRSVTSRILEFLRFAQHAAKPEVVNRYILRCAQQDTVDLVYEVIAPGEGDSHDWFGSQYCMNGNPCRSSRKLDNYPQEGQLSYAARFSKGLGESPIAVRIASSIRSR